MQIVKLGVKIRDNISLQIDSKLPQLRVRYGVFQIDPRDTFVFVRWLRVGNIQVPLPRDGFDKVTKIRTLKCCQLQRRVQSRKRINLGPNTKNQAHILEFGAKPPSKKMFGFESKNLCLILNILAKQLILASLIQINSSISM